MQRPDYELYIAEIAADILGEQSPKRLYVVRGKVYELLANCIPPELIIKVLSRGPILPCGPPPCTPRV